MKNRAVIYARYSSDRQTEQSIEGQIDVCKKYAKTNNLLIVKTYIDRAMTGTNDNRPDFRKMILDSKNGNFDYVLVYKLDRFSRNRYDSAINKAALKKNGVKLLSACENITDSPEGIILESMLEGMNEYYSAELSQKVKRGQTESIKKHQYLGGKLTYGYLIENKKYVINNEEAKIVSRIFNDYAKGKKAKAIVNELKDEQIYNNNGRFFVLNSILNLLKNKKYIGTFVFNGKEYENYLPSIIDVQLFDIVQNKLKANQREVLKKSNDVNYILSGKLYCGECGCLMLGESGTGKLGKIYRYYKCNGHKRNSTKCRNKTYYKDCLEEFILKTTQEQFLNNIKIDKLAEQIVKQNKKEILEKDNLKLLEDQLRTRTTELKNIIDSIKKGFYSETLKIEMQNIENEIYELKEQIEISKSYTSNIITKEEVIDWFNQFKIENLDKKTSELFINSLVNKIEALGNNITIYYNNSNRSVLKLPEKCMCSNASLVAGNIVNCSNTKMLLTSEFTILTTIIDF